MAGKLMAAFSVHWLSLLCSIELVSGQSGNTLIYTLYEEEPVNRFVCNVKVDGRLELQYPPEVLASLLFSFRYPQTGASRYFKIDVSTGEIRTSQVIDRESVPECDGRQSCDLNLDIQVKPVEHFQIIKVRVTLVDINDNSPTFGQERIKTAIAETTNPGALIPIPSARDGDSGEYGVQGYRLGSDTPGSENFDLQVTEHSDSSMDINIVLLKKLDRETVSHYELYVYAYDGDTPQHSGSVIIDITVTDANDNTPVFDNTTYEKTIFENLPFRTTILQVHATDPDSGAFGEVVYSFAPSTQAQYSNLFGINNLTGEIYVKGLIDYEQGQSYVLNIQASDKGENALPTFAKVHIRVLDLNDHAPSISVNVLTASGDAEVAEGAQSGMFVAFVSVSDPDLGDSGIFDCDIDNDNFQLLNMIDSITEFKIVTRQVFDRETESQYSISLFCTDHGQPSQSDNKQITVRVLDVNDNTPVFSQGHYFATLAENNSLNEFVIKVDATDRDSGPNSAIKYSLQGADNLLVIDSISGVIKANSVFDYEVSNSYELTATASDHGDPPRSSVVPISLVIEDVNDNQPKFTLDACFFSVEEGLPSGTRVGKPITATDDDSRKYNNITYSISPSTAGNQHFTIDLINGQITTSTILDRESQEVYHLEVIAENPGTDVSSTLACTVNVRDVNDNPPTLVYSNNTFQISNLTPVNYVITKVSALDPDAEDNGKVLFHISPLNGMDGDDFFFKMNEVSGDLMVAQSLADITHRVIELRVTAQDRGSPPKISAGSLQVVIDQSLAAPLTGESSLLSDHLMVILGAVLGLIFIIVVITILLCAVRYRNRRGGKPHRLEKALSGGHAVSHGSGAGDSYTDDDISLKSGGVGGGCVVDQYQPPSNHSYSPSNGALEHTRVGTGKRGVTFTFDQDQAYIQQKGGRGGEDTSSADEEPQPAALTLPRRTPPPHSISPRHPAVSLHPEGSRERGGGSGASTPQRSNTPDRQGNKYPHITDPRKYGHQTLGIRAYDRSPTHPSSGLLHPTHTHPRTAGAGRQGNTLTPNTLEMHDILNLSHHTDIDSECSGTDSGRGPSEEGDGLVLAGGIPQPHSLATGLPNHIHRPMAQAVYSNPQYRIDPHYTGVGHNHNVKKRCPGNHYSAAPRRQITHQQPLVKPTPVQPLSTNTSQTHISDNALGDNSIPMGDNTKTMVDNTRTSSDNLAPKSDNQTVPPQQWDPLNYHTSRKPPKVLDARDLISLQNNTSGPQQSETPGAGTSKPAAGLPPPIPPKRDVSLRHTDYNANSAASNSTYDIPQRLINNNTNPRTATTNFREPTNTNPHTAANFSEANNTNPRPAANLSVANNTNPRLTATNLSVPRKEVRFAEELDNNTSQSVTLPASSYSVV